MNVPLDSRITGKAGHSEAVRHFMKYVSEKEGVWVTTRRAIAEHYGKEFPSRGA